MQMCVRTIVSVRRDAGSGPVPNVHVETGTFSEFAHGTSFCLKRFQMQTSGLFIQEYPEQ